MENLLQSVAGISTESPLLFPLLTIVLCAIGLILLIYVGVIRPRARKRENEELTTRLSESLEAAATLQQQLHASEVELESTKGHLLGAEDQVRHMTEKTIHIFSSILRKALDDMTHGTDATRQSYEDLEPGEPTSLSQSTVERADEAAEGALDEPVELSDLEVREPETGAGVISPHLFDPERKKD